MPMWCISCNADFELDHGGRCPYCGRLLTKRRERPSFRFVLMGFLFLLAAGGVGYWFLSGDYLKVKTLWGLLYPKKVFEAGMQPPAFKVKEISGPTYSVQELRGLRGLFEKRQFEALTSIAAEIQAKFEHDASYEHQVYDLFRLFETVLPEYRELLDAWVEVDPSHFAPYLARARYYYTRAWASRGYKLAAETSEEQFQGMHYFFAKAAQDLASALAFNHRLLPAYTMRIDIYNAEGNEAQEDAAFDEARTLFPSSFLLYHTMLRAKLPRWGGSYAEMDRIAGEAFKQVEANPRLYTLFGEVYADQPWYCRKENDYDAALALYSKAIDYGAYFSFLEERGRTYHSMKRYPEALKDLTEAISLRPGVALPYISRAYVYVSMEDMDNAKQDINFANLQFPGDPHVLEANDWIAHRLLGQGHAVFKTDLVQAIARYDMSIALNRESAEAFYWRGVAYSKLKNTTLATADLKRAIELNPRYFECCRTLDYILASQGKWDEILDIWNRFLALEPNNAEAYFERAGTHKHKGDMDSALADLDRACDLGKQEACNLRKRYR